MLLRAFKGNGAKDGAAWCLPSKHSGFGHFKSQSGVA